MFACGGDLVRLFDGSPSPKPTAASASNGVSGSALWATLSIFDRDTQSFPQPKFSATTTTAASDREDADPNAPMHVHSECQRVLAFGGVIDRAISTPIPVICLLTAKNVVVLGTLDAYEHAWVPLCELQLPATARVHACSITDGPCAVLLVTNDTAPSASTASIVVLSGDSDGAERWVVNAQPIARPAQLSDWKLLHTRVLPADGVLHAIVSGGPTAAEWSEWTCELGVSNSLKSKELLLLPKALKVGVGCLCVASPPFTDTSVAVIASPSRVLEVDLQTYAILNEIKLADCQPFFVRRHYVCALATDSTPLIALTVVALIANRLATTATAQSVDSKATTALIPLDDCEVRLYASSAVGAGTEAGASAGGFVQLASWPHVPLQTAPGQRDVPLQPLAPAMAMDDFLFAGQLQLLLERHPPHRLAANPFASAGFWRAGDHTAAAAPDWDGRSGVLLTDGQTYWIGDEQHKTSLHPPRVGGDTVVESLRARRQSGAAAVDALRQSVADKERLLAHGLHVLRDTTAQRARAAAVAADALAPTGGTASAAATAFAAVLKSPEPPIVSDKCCAGLVPVGATAPAASASASASESAIAFAIPVPSAAAAVSPALRWDEFEASYCTITAQWQLSFRLHNTLVVGVFDASVAAEPAASEIAILSESDCIPAIEPKHSARIGLRLSGPAALDRTPFTLTLVQRFYFTAPFGGSVSSTSQHSVEFGTVELFRWWSPPLSALIDATIAPSKLSFRHAFQSVPAAAASAAAATSTAQVISLPYECALLVSAQPPLAVDVASDSKQLARRSVCDAGAAAGKLLDALVALLRGVSQPDAAGAFELTLADGNRVRVHCQLLAAASTASTSIDMRVSASSAAAAAQFVRTFFAAPSLPAHTLSVNHASPSAVAGLETLLGALRAENTLVCEWVSSYLQSIAKLKTQAGAISALKLSRDLQDSEVKTALQQYAQFIRHCALRQLRTDAAAAVVLSSA